MKIQIAGHIITGHVPNIFKRNSLNDSSRSDTVLGFIKIKSAPPASPNRNPAITGRRELTVVATLNNNRVTLGVPGDSQFNQPPTLSRSEKFASFTLTTGLAPPAEPLSGNFKVVIGLSKTTVALAPKENGTFRIDRSNADLADTSTVVYNHLVSEKLMLAPNAGISLDRLTSQEGPIKLSSFQVAAHDLDHLHHRGTFLLDIKPANLAMRAGEEQVNFIDVDDRIIDGDVDNKILFTPGYTTNKLLNKLKDSNFKEGKSSDQYAFLISMIACTTSDADLRYVTNVQTLSGNFFQTSAQAMSNNVGVAAKPNSSVPSELEITPESNASSLPGGSNYDTVEFQGSVEVPITPSQWDVRLDKLKDDGPRLHSLGKMNDENAHLFGHWLRENVKNEHQDAVAAFLRDPAESELPELYSVFNFVN